MWPLIQSYLFNFSILSFMVLVIPIGLVWNAIAYFFPETLWNRYIRNSKGSARDVARHETNIGRMQVAVHASMSVSCPKVFGRRYGMEDIRTHCPRWLLVMSVLLTVCMGWVILALVALFLS